MNDSTTPVKILVIDDESSIRQSFTDYLEDRGFEVLSAENGRVGIKLLKREQPQIVLVDLRMPKMDGLEFLRQSRLLTPDLPVIVISGANRIEEVVKAQQLGSWDYLVKPLENLSMLGHAVDKALEKARLLQENRVYQENLEALVHERTADLEQANANLVASEERYRTLFERSSDAIFLMDAQTGRYINANQAAERLTGYSISEIKSKTLKMLAPKGATGRLDLIRTLETTKEFGEVTYVRTDGTERIATLTAFPLQNGKLVVGIAHDITERVRADEELKKLGTAMRQSPVVVMITDPQGNIEYVNPSFTQVTGYSAEEVLGKNPRILQGGGTSLEEYERLWAKILSGNVWRGEFHNKKKNGELYWEEASISAIHDDSGNTTHFIALKEDITERKAADEAIQRYTKRLKALHKIDQSITGSLDLKGTLNILLEHLLSQLEVDAAAVLRYQDNLQTLEFTQGQGFRTTALQHTELRLGQGYAGKIALHKRHTFVFIPELDRAENAFLESPHFSEEGFVAYYGVPLIAKGKLVGVLEIYHRSVLDPHEEWVEYLDTLANQAAIAIDNVSLFNDLQRTNMELTLAYDATIEGWARALELRDMETEGHSRRVKDLIMQVTRQMRISDMELVHIRRGALLHDIGKMGIPDKIMQKKGKLTKEEWIVMHRHPVYAMEWLSPIEFLRPALDIPYCHHERWNGSGYPRGLKGEQIPLSARIFAVVDVWDALLSDRAYRRAWSVKKTRTYIREQSGKLFDPQVVNSFFEVVDKP